MSPPDSGQVTVNVAAIAHNRSSRYAADILTGGRRLSRRLPCLRSLEAFTAPASTLQSTTLKEIMQKFGVRFG